MAPLSTTHSSTASVVASVGGDNVNSALVQGTTSTAFPASVTAAPTVYDPKTNIGGGNATLPLNEQMMLLDADPTITVDNTNGGLLYGTIAGVIVLLLSIIVAVAVFVKRRQRGGPSAVTARNSKFSTRKSQVITSIPRNSAVFTDLALSQNFQRCAAFDYLRHRTALGDVEDRRLVLIYDLLGLSRPQMVELPPLRHLFNQFLRKSVARDPSRFTDRSVDFLESAMVDALLEDWIDLYANLTSKAGLVLGGMYNHLNRRGGISEQGCTFPNYDEVGGGGASGSDDYEMPAGFDTNNGASRGVYEEPVQRKSSYIEPGVGIDGLPNYRPAYAEIADYDGFYELIDNAVNDPLYAQPDGYWGDGDQRIYEGLKEVTAACRTVVAANKVQLEPLYQQITAASGSPPGPVYDSAAALEFGQSEPRERSPSYEQATMARLSGLSAAYSEPSYDMAKKQNDGDVDAGGALTSNLAIYELAKKSSKWLGEYMTLLESVIRLRCRCRPYPSKPPIVPSFTTPLPRYWRCYCGSSLDYGCSRIEFLDGLAHHNTRHCRVHCGIAARGAFTWTCC